MFIGLVGCRFVYIFVYSIRYTNSHRPRRIIHFEWSAIWFSIDSIFFIVYLALQCAWTVLHAWFHHLHVPLDIIINRQTSQATQILYARNMHYSHCQSVLHHIRLISGIYYDMILLFWKLGATKCSSQKKMYIYIVTIAAHLKDSIFISALPSGS